MKLNYSTILRRGLLEKRRYLARKDNVLRLNRPIWRLYVDWWQWTEVLGVKRQGLSVTENVIFEQIRLYGRSTPSQHGEAR